MYIRKTCWILLIVELENVLKSTTIKKIIAIKTKGMNIIILEFPLEVHVRGFLYLITKLPRFTHKCTICKIPICKFFLSSIL